MRKAISTILLCLLLTMLMLQSCIKENLAECVYRLTFNFEPPDLPDNSESFFKGVSNVSAFAFDENGVYVDEFNLENPEQGSVLLINLPDGKYTFVVWAGLSRVQIDGANLSQGVTRIEDFYIPSYTMSEIGNTVSPDPLYYGIVRDAALALPPEILSQEVQMVQSTKPFSMRISGLDEGDYQLVISNNAGRYSHDNLLVPPLGSDRSTVTPMVLASSPSLSAYNTVSDVPRADYRARTGLLWPVGLGEREVSIVDVSTGYPVLTMSLSDLLSKLPGMDFDNESAVDMIINFRSSIDVDVNINGWWIIYSDNEI